MKQAEESMSCCWGAWMCRIQDAQQRRNYGLGVFELKRRSASSQRFCIQRMEGLAYRFCHSCCHRSARLDCAWSGVWCNYGMSGAVKTQPTCFIAYTEAKRFPNAYIYRMREAFHRVDLSQMLCP